MSLHHPSWSLFFSFIFWPFYPQMERRKFPSMFCIPSYPDIAGQIWSRKHVNSKISISGEILENWIFFPTTLILITRDSLWSARSSGLIQSLLFDLLFGLQNSKIEFYVLHMFCRSSSHIFENGDERLELSCITSFAAQNQSMFGFTVEFYLFSNLVSENTIISHDVNNSKRDPKF